MRRTRKDATTKVWHNPELNTFAKRGGGNGGVARAPAENAEDRRSANQHRAALEALFAPKREPEPEEAGAKNGAAKAGGRIVLAPPPQADPRTAERQKLLNKLLVAEGRPGVSKAADAFITAGFAFPEEQDVYLQLLEHASEDHVRNAIDVLDGILAGELPKRRAVLDSRLRRIEQFAEDAATRTAAERLRRRVSGRSVAPGSPGLTGHASRRAGLAVTARAPVVAGPSRAEFEAELRQLLQSHEQDTANERCVECHGCERCKDSTFCKASKGLARCHYCVDSQRCSDCTHCRGGKDLVGCNHCVACERCAQSSYLVRSIDCSGCTYCFGCVGLSKKDFHVLNRPYDRSAYFALTARLARELGLG